MILYWGDPHFGHANAIRFDQRPFLDVNQMDSQMIDIYNAEVDDKDDVYFVGDVTFRSVHNPEWYLKQLKGKKHLVVGNHDDKLLKDSQALSYFETVQDMAYIKDGDTWVHICHYPMAEWRGAYHGSVHVYSHIHGSNNTASRFMHSLENTYNAGCMLYGYKPVTLDKMKHERANVIEQISKMEYRE